jgi:hypothetical protein
MANFDSRGGASLPRELRPGVGRLTFGPRFSILHSLVNPVVPDCVCDAPPGSRGRPLTTSLAWTTMWPSRATRFSPGQRPRTRASRPPAVFIPGTDFNPAHVAGSVR